MTETTIYRGGLRIKLRAAFRLLRARSWAVCIVTDTDTEIWCEMNQLEAADAAEHLKAGIEDVNQAEANAHTARVLANKKPDQ